MYVKGMYKGFLKWISQWYADKPHKPKQPCFLNIHFLKQFVFSWNTKFCCKHICIA